ncbi:ferredoxin--NADP reductase [Rhodococcoides kyotonense]|uniref:3-ketosteroid 9alpha-monooxygenase subunit B n=1 Tax=Rhodococcoides kyotonense TaxID=398843 RepID=A0A239MIJ7_9NOCA|nr:ferredoxin--NADP reductase [Rhodococcus kyotonensis]SNT41629.1 3-ketosteroid 9alpha-monooxygenase subunit B [Rhodococcus kyotonensis]
MTTVDAPHSTRSVLLTVAEVVDETADARSIVFDAPQNFHYLPGQFLTLRIPSERTGSVARCYSLASSPHGSEPPKVTVKRTYDGYGSNWVCDNIQPGDVVEALPPSGRFTPKDLDDDFYLLAAGSGITPVMSILKSALSEGVGKIALFYANRDENSVIFGRELRTLAAEYPHRLAVQHWLESLQGLPTVDQLSTLASPYRERHAFMCGPSMFMDAAHKGLASSGFPRNRVRREIFVSLVGDPFVDVTEAEVSETEVTEAGVTESPVHEDDATAVVELDGETHTLTWPRSKTLVDIMLAGGLDVPYSCREGECGTCACTMTEGEVKMENTEILDDEDIADGMILGCQARPVSDHIEVRF